MSFYDKPIEDPDMSMIGDTSVLEGLVDPEDLGLDGYDNVGPRTASTPIHTKPANELMLDDNSKNRKPKVAKHEDCNQLQDSTKVFVLVLISIIHARFLGGMPELQQLLFNLNFFRT